MKDKFNGTQGAWRAYDNNRRDSTLWIIQSKTQGQLAEIDSSAYEGESKNRREEEAKANAKLIAAAPDLLETLIQADSWFSFNTHPSANEISKFRKSLQAAIQKALS